MNTNNIDTVFRALTVVGATKPAQSNNNAQTFFGLFVNNVSFSEWRESLVVVVNNRPVFLSPRRLPLSMSMS